jgi:DNA-binding NarL/FixJ family response regulator
MPINIFIADDHAIVREGLVHLLTLQGDLQVVGSAADGREAVNQVVRLQPDVVVLDIHMPDMNGIEATRQLSAKLPSAAVVILSMHASPEHVFHALEAGARAYLQKESAAQELVEAVRSVHAGRRYLSPRIAALVAEHVGRRPISAPLQQLSRREREILQLVVEGHTSARIGQRLNLSPKTVDTYRSRMMQKLGIDDVTGLVKFAIRQGLITLD